MSKLTRVLTISVVLAAMSLGGVAHAQERDPAPAGATQQDPTPVENPPANPDPGATPDPGGTPAQTPTQTPVQKPPAATTTTTTTRPPVVRPSTRVTVSPASGRAGTTVTVVADVRGTCDPVWTFFQDRTQVGNLRATRPVTIVRWNGRRLVATYIVSSRDAVGRGRFGISCDMRTDTYRVDYASFRVLPASSDAVTGSRAGGDGNGGGEATPLPGQAGTDQVGSDQTGAELGAGEDGGLDPVWLLLPTALLLVVLAVVLRLLYTARPQH